MDKPTLKINDAIGTSAGFCRCQVCGATVGAGLTHCLRCRNLRSTPVSQPSAASARPLGMLAVLALAGVAAAGVWYARRDAATAADVDAGNDAAIIEEADGDPAGTPPMPTLADAAAINRRAASAAAAAPARSAPTVARPDAQRPAQATAARADTRAVKLASTCKACGGSGRTFSGGQSRTCQICRGTPNKIRWVSPTHAFCPACAGFGRILEMRDGARRPTDCRECRGCGLVKK